MRLVTKLLSTAAVAGAVAAAVPSTAAAVPLSCSFNAVGNTSPPIMLIGGTGTFVWDTAGQPLPTLCSPVGPPLVPARIVSRGSFVNVVCGTGTWVSTDTTVTYAGIHSVTYKIEFTGPRGVVDVLSVDGTPDPAPVNGLATIVFTDGTCASPAGVQGFQIHGYFHAV